MKTGRNIAQAVSRRLPTAAARVRPQVRSCGNCGGQSGTGGGFLRVLRFPLPVLIPPTTPHSSSSIIRGWYSRPVSGRRTKWTQSHPTKHENKIKAFPLILQTFFVSQYHCTRFPVAQQVTLLNHIPCRFQWPRV
jgi:hypothetical protein